jgi:hypothetical protein
MSRTRPRKLVKNRAVSQREQNLSFLRATARICTAAQKKGVVMGQ